METFFANSQPWLYHPRGPLKGFFCRDADDLLKRLINYFLPSAIEELLYSETFNAEICVPDGIDYSRYISNAPTRKAAGLFLSNLLIGSTTPFQEPNFALRWAKRFWRRSS